MQISVEKNERSQHEVVMKTSEVVVKTRYYSRAGTARKAMDSIMTNCLIERRVLLSGNTLLIRGGNNAVVLKEEFESPEQAANFLNSLVEHCKEKQEAIA